jgi:AraC-like DNA-binding protein
MTLLGVLFNLADISGAQRLSSGRVVPIGPVDEQRRIGKICSSLEAHFDEPINFRRLADEIGMHQSSMCRFFKRATGRTLTTYVNELRIGAASELLLNTDSNALEIALRVGFDNYAYFCRRFKKMKGCTPGSLRKEFSRA